MEFGGIGQSSIQHPPGAAQFRISSLADAGRSTVEGSSAVGGRDGEDSASVRNPADANNLPGRNGSLGWLPTQQANCCGTAAPIAAAGPVATVVAAVPGADPADAAAATAAASAELLPTAVGLALLFSVFDCSAGVRLSCGAHFGGGNVRVLFLFFF